MPAAAPSLPSNAIHTAPSSDAVAVAGTRRTGDRLLPWLAAALTFTAALLAIDPLPVGVFYDDAQYVILAKALATGNGYRFLNLPGAPLATHFPPGYPLFLALLWKLSPSFPENVALFKLANAALLACVAVVAFRFARNAVGLPAPLAFVATIAGTATIPSLVLSSSVMSEPLFLALLLPLLGAVERAAPAIYAHDERIRLRLALALGASIGAIALVRSHGAVLLPVAALLLAVRGRRRDAIVCSIAALGVVAPWVIWVHAHDAAIPALLRGAYGSYTGWFASGVRDEGLRLLTGTVPDNVATLLWTIARCLAPAGRPLLEVLAVSAFAILAVAGIPTLWRRASAMVLFVALYLAIVIVWPFSPLRFVWGIWPVLMIFPAAGAHALWSDAPTTRSPSRRVVAVTASAIVCAGALCFNVAGFANAWWGANARFHARRILGQLSWVAAKTRPGDVVASDTEGAVYLYTGRRSIPITTFTAAEYVRERTLDERVRTMRELLERYAPSFVLVTSPPLAEAAARVAATDSATLRRVDSLPRGLVYRHVPPTTVTNQRRP